MELELVRLDPELPLPGAAHPGDAGIDLYARDGTTVGRGGGRQLIATGLALAIPLGFAGFIQPRSGLALKHGITVLNTPGLIDSGYRDELKVIVLNTDPDSDYVVERGDRIAQLVIQRVETVSLVVVDSLSESTRDQGGFGSTGR
ncbi:MAG: dUTP diphosphatase [Actinobacteria bacterium]|nr:dUTP diphosphatase [Actinomycetota bacterium]MCB9388171.1 dUTP diphosphatase [Acidimicrobiia bacterium]